MKHYHHVGDFLDVLELELARERTTLAALVDRVEALAELRLYAVSVAADLARRITADDVFAAPSNEREHAQLQALTDRITRGVPGHSASRIADGAGHPEETAEGL